MFDDEPVNCTIVCETCHLMAVPTIEEQTQNPKLVRTDEIYPALFPDAGEEVGWDTIELLHQSCRNCHDDITENHEDNHIVFIEYSEVSLPEGSFKPTELKLFDDYIYCTTCHSPHLEHEALLRISNAGSSLCLDCHTI